MPSSVDVSHSGGAAGALGDSTLTKLAGLTASIDPSHLDIHRAKYYLDRPGRHVAVP